MTEEQAREWLASQFGGRAVDRLQGYVEILSATSHDQNLISANSITAIWARHIADSAQLVPLAGDAVSSWYDIGSGAGLPGLVVAMLSDAAVTLIEPRALRVSFLRDCVTHLGCANVAVFHGKAQRFDARPGDIISARAVAAVDTLFKMTTHVASKTTRYLLPRGRSVTVESEGLQTGWHGMFHVKQSISDPESGILIADQVSAR